MSPFQRAVFLGGVPSLFMLISTLIGLGKKVPDNIAGALQHFAAGVLLCTVGTELLPEIVNAEGWAENIAACVGFFCGVAVLILLGMLSPDPVEAMKEKEEEKQDMEEAATDTDEDLSIESAGFFRCYRSPTEAQKQQMREMKFVIAGRRFRQRQSLVTLGQINLPRSMSLSSLALVSTDGEQQPLMAPISPTAQQRQHQSAKSNYEAATTECMPETSLTEGSTTTQKTAPGGAESSDGVVFPMAFFLAVAIDSSLDGLLIGIASMAGKSAGPMMSASLTVEMTFLGLTLATTLHGQPWPKAAFAATVGPLCLVLSAGLGGLMAYTLSHSPVLFVGMLSFGASALLFMVAEELLLDAHEDGEHVWWVDLQLYIGFFASIIAGKFVR